MSGKFPTMLCSFCKSLNRPSPFRARCILMTAIPKCMSLTISTFSRWISRVNSPIHRFEHFYRRIPPASKNGRTLPHQLDCEPELGAVPNRHVEDPDDPSRSVKYVRRRMYTWRFCSEPVNVPDGGQKTVRCHWMPVAVQFL